MDSLHENVSSLSISQPTEEDNSEDIVQCPICQEKTTKTCSACKSVAYCCVDHQRMDWKNHKKVCQPFSIKKVEGMGLGWVATRDLPAGLLLHDEAPAIQSPNWINFCQSDVGVINCVTCGIKMKSKETCSTCSWPVCSVKCEKNPLHTENECKEFVSRKLKYPLPPNWPPGLLIVCIRANMMKVRDPKKFEQLMALQDFCDIPSVNEELQKSDLPDGMLKVLTGPNSLDGDEFRKLVRIFKVNGFEGKSEPFKRHFCDGCQDCTCLYIKICRINHSCVANCSITPVLFPHPKNRIRTVIPVKKGEEITINFYDDGEFGFMPTDSRQNRMRKNGFICQCKRCLDPTELGSFLSGIKCFNCSSHLSADSDPEGNQVGFLLPVDPLDLGSPLECHHCHVKYPFSKVMTTLPNTVQKVFYSVQQRSSSNTFDLPFLDILLNHYAESREVKEHLHPNHYVIQSLMRGLIGAQIYRLGKMTEQELDKYVSRLEFLLTVDDKLYPSPLYHPRYMDLLYLQTAVSVLFHRFGGGMCREKIQKLSRIFNETVKEQAEFLMVELDRASEEVKFRAVKGLKRLKDVKHKFEQSLLDA